MDCKMTRKFSIFFVLLLLLVASAALAITIRVNNVTANNVIITPQAESEPAEPGYRNVFAGGLPVFASGAAAFVQLQ